MTTYPSIHNLWLYLSLPPVCLVMKMGYFFLATVLLLILCRSSSAYIPTDKIFISCGDSTTGSTAGRLWIGDNDLKYAPLDHQKSLPSKAKDKPSPVFNVPYTTARLSRSEFSYSFPVSMGPKFVRLHFFSSDYDQNLSRSDAIFSVTSSAFTLLQKFNVSFVAEYLDSRSFYKEFCVVVQDNERLNLTFSPSTNHPNAYALINGIVIVSMPPDLYYHKGTINGSRQVEYLGSRGNPLTLSYGNALETIYRINIGGRWIPPEEDTGMFRSWTAPDDPYVTEDLGTVLPVNPTTQISFDKIPAYVAPEDVYRTARSMGVDRNITTSYILTWSFLVDSNFNYLVQLHFCEIQEEINSSNQRVFEIFIDNLVAQEMVDIIKWTGGRGIPIYKDYAVFIFDSTSKKINLTVGLHTAPEMLTVYSDAILNGVEIVKISNHDNSLAVPSQDPVVQDLDRPPLIHPSAESGGISEMVIIVATAGVRISGLLSLCLLCFLAFRRGSSRGLTYANKGLLHGPAWYTAKSTNIHNSSLQTDLCRHFSLEEIKAATNGFDEIFIVGVGGFGNVYRGYVDGGSTLVAIKRLNPRSQQGAQEFMTEIEMLSQLRHLHLVSLIGCCHEGGEMILVYDYMCHGSLRDHLYNTEHPPLSWKQRLEICLGAARGLQYLHMGTKYMIIHRDIKTTNILLDEKWVAKVSDFGLSKMRTSNMSKSHISTIVKGTFGYLDPEYFRFHRLTEKSDVYSFGVVLFEVLCARPPVDTNLETEEIGLACWAQSCYQNGTLYQIIDPNLKAEIKPECLEKFTKTAMSCLHDEGLQRPSMNNIVRSLELAVQLQEPAQEVIAAVAPTSTKDGRLQGEEDTNSLPVTETGSEDGILEL